MDELSEIIKKRSAPGILIFDMKNNLQYSNKEALEMMPGLEKETIKSRSGKTQFLPDVILNLCNHVKGVKKEKNISHASKGKMHSVVLNSESGALCSMRAFCIGHHPDDKKPTHIMVLLEKVIKKHQVDYEKIRNDFQITKRESDVLMLICKGLTNKKISKALSIGEYTVKDHIKNIMRKMNAASRSEVITRSLQR